MKVGIVLSFCASGAVLLAGISGLPAQDAKPVTMAAPKAQTPPAMPAQASTGKAPTPNPDEEGRPAVRKPTSPRSNSRKKPRKLPYDQRTNLNAASKEELMKLPGMSEDLAERVIAKRPYKSKADLVVKGAIHQGFYLTLKDRIAVGPPPRK
jgi:competence protein ComEA